MLGRPIWVGHEDGILCSLNCLSSLISFSGTPLVLVPLRVRSLINQEIIPLIPTPFPLCPLFLSYPNLFSFWSMKDLSSVCVEFTSLRIPSPHHPTHEKQEARKLYINNVLFIGFLFKITI